MTIFANDPVLGVVTSAGFEHGQKTFHVDAMMIAPCGSSRGPYGEPDGDALSAGGAATTVLIVDDDDDLREGLRDLIEAGGDYVVETAASLREARVRIAESAPDIALLDVKLGSGNGIDLVPVLRAASATTRCIVMTAFRGAGYYSQAMTAGADDFLNKPIEADRLFRLLSGKLD